VLVSRLHLRQEQEEESRIGCPGFVVGQDGDPAWKLRGTGAAPVKTLRPSSAPAKFKSEMPRCLCAEDAVTLAIRCCQRLQLGSRLGGRTRSEQKPGKQMLAETAGLGFCATPVPRIWRRSGGIQGRSPGAQGGRGMGVGRQDQTRAGGMVGMHAWPGPRAGTLHTERVTCSGHFAWLARGIS
jgi:hypothetical protein